MKGAAEFYTNDLVRGGGSCLDGFEVIAGPHRHAARVGAGCATFSGARTAAPSQPAGCLHPPHQKVRDYRGWHPLDRRPPPQPDTDES